MLKMVAVCDKCCRAVIELPRITSKGLFIRALREAGWTVGKRTLCVRCKGDRDGRSGRSEGGC